MNAPAPVKRSVALAGLLAAAVVAVIVCALHAVNAGSLRGVIPAASCEIEAAQMLYMRGGDARALAGGADGGAIALVREAAADETYLRITGALMRPGRTPGAVNVRVGLIPEDVMGGARGESVILLNTEMVREPELAAAYGCDDHCGFAALAGLDGLGDGAFAVVLIDESDAARKLIDTGVHIGLTGGALSTAVKEAAGDA